MRHFTKICDFNVSRLLFEIQSQPELWNNFRLRKDGEGTPHREMDDIWLRYNDINNTPAAELNDEHDSIWYPAYYCLPSAREIIFSLMTIVCGERLGGVLITKIPPGGKIEPHIDDTWHVRYYNKFYVSLKSEPGAEFCCGDDIGVETLCPRVGEVYHFDNKKNHWVNNNSNSDRMTMIVCIKTHKFGERYAG